MDSHEEFTTKVIPDWNSDKVTNITDRHTLTERHLSALW